MISRPVSLVAALACALACWPGMAAADVNIALDGGLVWQTPKAGQDTQAFLRIHNTGSSPDVLTAQNCTVAGSTLLVDGNGQTLPSLVIPAGQTVMLSAKGPHLLLKNLRYSVDTGSILPCAFSFAQAGDVLGYLNAAPPPTP